MAKAVPTKEQAAIAYRALPKLRADMERLKGYRRMDTAMRARYNRNMTQAFEYQRLLEAFFNDLPYEARVEESSEEDNLPF